MTWKVASALFVILLLSATASASLFPLLFPQHRTTQAILDVNATTLSVTGNSFLVNVNVSKDLNAENIHITRNLEVDQNLSVRRPYGMFSSNQTQTIVSTSNAYYMTFNTTELSYLVSKKSDVNFTVQQQGVYLIEISIIAQSNAVGKRVNIWVRKNNTDVPNSNTVYDFKSAGYVAVIAVPFIINLNSTDTFAIMYSGDSTGITLPAIAAVVSPPAPATPSAIMTLTKLSEITS